MVGKEITGSRREGGLPAFRLLRAAPPVYALPFAPAPVIGNALKQEFWGFFSSSIALWVSWRSRAGWWSAHAAVSLGLARG